MKTANAILFLFLTFFVTQAKAESPGRVILVAQIEANNDLKNMQISVIDLSTKAVVQREDVSTRFFSSLPINGRYSLYFKKAGHPAIRMIVDTHIPNSQNYCVHFSLNLKNLNSNLETGISISAGTLKMDHSDSGFILQQSGGSNCNRVVITSCRTDTGGSVQF